MNKTKRSWEASAFKGNLVGHFFHSLNAEGQLEWQGVIMSEPRRGWYLVQLFDWFIGETSVRKLVPFKQMENWFFYGTDEEMRYSADHGTCRRGGPYRKDFSNGEPVEATQVKAALAERNG